MQMNNNDLPVCTSTQISTVIINESVKVLKFGLS